MKYLLDTDTCIHLLRGTASVIAQVLQRSPDDLAISSITSYELLFGALRCARKRRERELAKVETFSHALHFLPFTNQTALHAARIRADLEAEGHAIGPMNTLIAASGREHDLILVTGNRREFDRIPGLRCESWQ